MLIMLASTSDARMAIILMDLKSDFLSKSMNILAILAPETL